MALIIENKYHKILPPFIVQPHSTKSWLTVEKNPFSWDPLEAHVLQDLFRSTDFQKKYWCQVSQNIPITYSWFCLFYLYSGPKYTCSVVIFVNLFSFQFHAC